MSLNILLVDDDPQSLESTKRILEHSGYQVVCASSGQAALDQLQKQKPDLVVTDVRMPGMSGMEFVEAYQKKGYEIPFVVMTAFGQVQDAVWAMKMGAVDFLLKPFKRQALSDAVEQVVVRLKKHAEPSPVAANSLTQNFIGSSRHMLELKVLIEQVAKTDASVLILGESGTGKEQVAKLVHEMSSRKSKPFIAVNCAAIPENLIESELFGYEKGAFSGANSSKAGLIEAANGGTLMLDEIGDMPLSLQPKLLRVLEEQKVRRLGATQEKSIEVRVLAATHQNLGQLVKAGKFRQDLFYRLDVMTLAIAPLRERMEDVPELTQYFLAKFSREYQKKISGIDTEAQAILLTHTWPGNVRELSNVLERAIVLDQDGIIQKTDLPLHLQEAVAEKPMGEHITIPLGMSLKEIEDLMIQKALDASKGDRAQAAKLLGVNERTIYRRISKTKEE
jgi:DNA-binding NtrC family response regulator